MAGVAAGARVNLLALSPLSSDLDLVVTHVKLNPGTVPTPDSSRVHTNIPGLQELNRTFGGTSGAALLQTYFRLPGDAQGTLDMENVSGGALTLEAGLFGLYKPRGKAIPLELMRPGSRSGMVIKSNPTPVSIGTSEATLLDFDAPDVAKGTRVYSLEILSNVGTAPNLTVNIYGDGMAYDGILWNHPGPLPMFGILRARGRYRIAATAAAGGQTYRATLKGFTIA